MVIMQLVSTKVLSIMSGKSSKQSWLDEFYFDVIGIEKYEVAFVLKLLLTLSHDQATVEQ